MSSTSGMDTKDPVSLLRTLQLSSYSEVEGDSDGEVMYTVEVSNPHRESRRNGENIPLISTNERHSSGDERTRR